MSTCDKCGKWLYRSRKAARAAARQVFPNGSDLRAYPCPAFPDFWHFGHNPLAVVLGRKSAADVYHRRPAA